MRPARLWEESERLTSNEILARCAKHWPEINDAAKQAVVEAFFAERQLGFRHLARYLVTRERLSVNVHGEDMFSVLMRHAWLAFGELVQDPAAVEALELTFEAMVGNRAQSEVHSLAFAERARGQTGTTSMQKQNRALARMTDELTFEDGRPPSAARVLDEYDSRVRQNRAHVKKERKATHEDLHWKSPASLDGAAEVPAEGSAEAVASERLRVEQILSEVGEECGDDQLLADYAAEFVLNDGVFGSVMADVRRLGVPMGEVKALRVRVREVVAAVLVRRASDGDEQAS